MSPNLYPANGCPEHLQLLALAEGTLTEVEATSVSNHVSSCKSCDMRLGAIEEKSDDLVRVLAMLPATSDDEETFQELQAQLLASPEVFGGSSSECTQSFNQLFQQDLPANLALPIDLGNYELLEQIGTGANGAVFRAQHRRLEKQVAIKLLLNIARPAVEEFLNEMRVIGKLDHPNIIQATDAGEHDGIYFLVMEYVPGLDVSSLLRKQGPLSTADACEITRQTALGLSVAHENELVHRDVKTSNLLFTAAGQVKLLDLGLATIPSRQANKLTNQSGPRGTADYMAPEQWREASSVTAQADIYSLGCTLFKLLTGSPPFRPLPDTAASIEAAHLAAEVPTVGGGRKDIPHGLDTFIRRMLAKDPKDRPTSAREVADNLAKYAHEANLPLLARKVLPESQTQAASLDTSPVSSRSIRTRRAALFAVLAGLGAIAWKINRRPTQVSISTGNWRTLSPVIPNLIYPSTQEFGNQHDGLVVDEVTDRIQIDSSQPALIHLGRPMTGAFRFRVNLKRADWSSATGVFFRLRAARTHAYEFQTFEVERSGDTWSLSWRIYGREHEEPNATLAGTDILDFKDAKTVPLQVTLGVSGFPQFHFGGQRVAQSDWTISREGREVATAQSAQLETAFAGHIGVFHSAGITRIDSPQLMYIK